MACGVMENANQRKVQKCELNLSPMDIDRVLVNGVELIKGSTFGNVEGSMLVS